MVAVLAMRHRQQWFIHLPTQRPIKSKVKYGTWICIAHRREAPLMRYVREINRYTLIRSVALIYIFIMGLTVQSHWNNTTRVSEKCPNKT